MPLNLILFPYTFATSAQNFQKGSKNHKIIKIAYLGGPGWPPFRQGSEDVAWKGHSGQAQAWNGRLGAPNKEIAEKSKFGG